jgi:drug/metabolite transporter (DMT)-like permease
MTRKGWLLFIAMSVFWGIPYFFIRIAIQELDPSVVVFVRVGIAAIILFPVALQRHLLQPLRKRWLAVAVLACVQIVGPFLLISYGELHITSSLTSLLIAAEPLLVALFALRFDASEQVRGLRLVGLIIGIGGVVTLLGFDVGGDEQRLLGAFLVLLAATCYAAGALMMKRPAIAALPTLGVVAAESAMATVLLLPLALTRLPARMPDLEVVASLLVLGLVCTALAWLTFFALVAEVGASRGTVFTYVNPAVSVLLGVGLLGERITVVMIVGFMLIVIGSWLSTSSQLPLWPLFRIRRGRQGDPALRKEP